MTERVTVEQNGERFVIEVPDGTSDADIQAFLAQQQGAGATSGAGAITQPPANPAENALAYGTQAATTAYGKYAAETGGGLIGDTYRVGKALSQATPEVIGQVASRPIHYTQEFIKAYAAGLPMAQSSLKDIAGSAVKGIGSSVMAPENLMTLPYNMAAYEQAKIRANPNAPEYANNPYAMSLRSQSTAQPMTQAQAGALNQRRAVQQMSTAGNPMPGTPEFAKLQQQYQDNQTLSQPADDKNFMARMTALSRKYLNIQ